MSKETNPGKVIKELYLKNTRVTICGDCCRPPEETEDILRRIARQVMEALSSKTS